jgi:hypothetical protein
MRYHIQRHSILLSLLISCYWCIAQNEPPVLSRVKAAHHARNHQVIVTYDLEENDGDSVQVSCFLNTAKNIPVELAGDVGFPVSKGKGKRIVCTYSGDLSLKGAFVRLVASDGHPADIRQLVKQVNVDSIQNLHRQVYGIRNMTDEGKVHLEEVRDIIGQYYSRQGLVQYRQDTSLSKVSIGNMSNSGAQVKAEDLKKIYPICNLIGVQKGVKKEEEVVILCAHYDTKPGSPGADDNGSGVAALLETARVLSKYESGKTIIFAAFDQEEEDMLGSQLFLFGGGAYPTGRIAAAINMDMIGYYSEAPKSQHVPEGYDAIFPDSYRKLANDEFKGNFILNTTNSQSGMLGAQFEQVAGRYVPSLKVISLVVPGNGLNAGSLAASDHAVFWLAGKPAIFLGDGANTRNPYYHSPGDKIDKISYPFMSDVTRAVVASLAEWADIKNSSAVIVTLTK